MVHIVTDFGPFVRHKDQILQNQLHYPETSEVLAMLTYGEGFTDKSIAYLLDLGAVVGYAYVEHFQTTQHRDACGTFGIFIHPAYRNKRFSYQLIEAVRDEMQQRNLLGQPLEVDHKALPLIRKIFGEDYPLKEILEPAD